MAATLTVFTGPMVSGKSTRLVSALDHEVHGDNVILLLKAATPAEDRTHGVGCRKKTVTNGNTEEAKFEEYAAETVGSIQEAEELFQKIKPQVIGIDEAHFLPFEFTNWIAGKLDKNECGNLQIYVSGLDTDYARRPFGIMPDLLAMADEVIKLRAKCDTCKGKKGHGIFTQKKSRSLKQIEVGNKKLYGAACRACHTIPAISDRTLE